MKLFAQLTRPSRDVVQWCIQTFLTKIECLLQCEITPGLVYDRDALESSFVDENVVKNISLHTGLKYTPWNSYENLFLKYARKYNRFYNPFPWLRKTYSGNLHPLLVYPYLIFSCLIKGWKGEGRGLVRLITLQFYTKFWEALQEV